MTFATYLLPTLFVVWCGGSAVAEIVPHRALYDLTGINLEKKSGMTAVVGKLAYEVTGSSCDGWSTTYRIANRYEKTEGGTQLSDTQVTAWEAGDGSEMTINQKNYLDQFLSEETSLTARTVPNSEGTVQQTRPSETTFKIPEKAMFPIAHLKKLLESAAKGTGRDSTMLFDGSDKESTFRSVSIIGALQSGKTRGTIAEAVQEMANMPSWPVTTGYYKIPDQNVELPDYQSSYVVFENGVSTALLFDYGTYQLRGVLVKLDMLPVEKCPQ
jgi:EipB-like